MRCRYISPSRLRWICLPVASGCAGRAMREDMSRMVVERPRLGRDRGSEVLRWRSRRRSRHATSALSMADGMTGRRRLRRVGGDLRLERRAFGHVRSRDPPKSAASTGQSRAQRPWLKLPKQSRSAAGIRRRRRPVAAIQLSRNRSLSNWSKSDPARDCYAMLSARVVSSNSSSTDMRRGMSSCRWQ